MASDRASKIDLYNCQRDKPDRKQNTNRSKEVAEDPKTEAETNISANNTFFSGKYLSAVPPATCFATVSPQLT